jgi:hypothetical protein
MFKRCLVPFCVTTLYALAVLYFANQFAAWFVPY